MLTNALAAWALAAQVAASPSQNSGVQPCSLDSARALSNRTTDGLPSRRLVLPVRSTEGAEATVYGDPARPSIIAATIYGETGKVDIWFAVGDAQTFVRHTVSNYAEPLPSDGAVASTVTTEFVICEGQTPSYPDMDSIPYDDAVDVLTVIRSRLVPVAEQ